MNDTNQQRETVTATENIKYLPVDFLWYPIGNNKPENTFYVADPISGLMDTRFFSQGIFTNPNYEDRGRSTIEDVLLKPYGTIPVLHVFRLQDILRMRVIQQKITSEEWYGKYIRYFPNVSFNSIYEADADDMRFGRTIDSYIEKRKTTIHVIERLLKQRTAELRYGTLTAIQYVRLLWQHRVTDFDGCAGMFYNISVTESRPYIRLLPSEGIPITKIHVQGALPIPTLDDPRLLSVWTKETSATPGSDMCIIKYVHRPIMGTSQSIYGTIHVLNDGTMTLLLQPPKEMRTLDPVIDFKHFTQRIISVFDGLPQSPISYSIKDVSLKVMFDSVPGGKLFTYKRLKARLPYFSYFFREIKKLPDDDAMMVLRYKAISQYVSEDEYFTFITQVATEIKLQGDDAARVIIPRIESEFQITETEARSLFTKWVQQKEQVMVQVPKDGEFTENNNPGIDIKIYSQHSTYYFQINRINSAETYQRIYTLLSILFIDKDEYFKENPDAMQLEKVEDAMAAQSKMIEATVEAAKPVKKVNPLLQKVQIGKKVPLAAVAAASDMDAPPVSALAALPASALPAVASVKADVSELEHAEQKVVNPTSWFINKLEMIDKKLFGFTPTSGTKGYTSQCQANAGRQPVILTKYMYDRMRREYTDPDLFWIIYPLTKVEKDPEPRDKDEVITVMRYGSSVDNVNYIFCPEYYCLSCEIMVRKKDFESPNGRLRPTDPPEKNPGRKPVNSCPFCKGSLITQTKGAIPGATVVRRIKTHTS